MTESIEPRVLEGNPPEMPSDPDKLQKAPDLRLSGSQLAECSARAQVVHVLRLLRPGSVVTVPTIENNLPPDSWLWQGRTAFQRRQLLRDSLTRLTSAREGARHRGPSVKERVSWDPEKYAVPAEHGELAPYRDAGAGRYGREPYPRCLVRISRGRYEITPDVYDPQTELERAFGVPTNATADTPWPELTEEQTEALLEAFPCLSTWDRVDLRRLAYTLQSFKEPGEVDGPEGTQQEATNAP